MMAPPTMRLWGVARWKQLLCLTIALGILVWLARDFAHRIPELEHWVADHGPMGWMVFVGVVVVCTSAFFPDTAFAVIAGVLYGAIEGTVLMVVASLCTAAVDYALARRIFRKTVDRIISKRPRMQAVQRAVDGEGFRLQFLLRLTPINPVLVNYALGAGNTPFITFLSACVGMAPVLAVEVYFGHAAKHAVVVAGGVGGHSPMHTVLTMIGLVLSVVVLLYITRIARKSLAAYNVVGTPRKPGFRTNSHP